MNNYFQFESDFVESLRCIPMQVRLKLDTCGIKLKLHQWYKFNNQERQALVAMPCITERQIQAYREFLSNLVAARTGEVAKDLPVETHPAWMSTEMIPDSVQIKAREVGEAVSLEQWASLEPIQRFALIKLSLSNHENKNFLPAMREFGLVKSNSPVS